jgi:hypothetical protein
MALSGYPYEIFEHPDFRSAESGCFSVRRPPDRKTANWPRPKGLAWKGAVRRCSFVTSRTAILSPKGEQGSARKQSRPLLADPLEGVRSVGAVK